MTFPGEKTEVIEAAERPMIQQDKFRQFVKFCVVGASSFTIDFGLLYFLHHYFLMPVPFAKTISFCVAVTNGFYWNRKWTFRAAGFRRKREQYAMFFIVNIVGWAMNVGIVTAVIRLITGEWSPTRTPGKYLLVATLAATAVVVFWNFYANKHWTFKPPESDNSPLEPFPPNTDE